MLAWRTSDMGEQSRPWPWTDDMTWMQPGRLRSKPILPVEIPFPKPGRSGGGCWARRTQFRGGRAGRRYHRWGQCPVWLVVVGWALGRDGRLGLLLVDVSPWYSRWPAERCIAPTWPRQPHANLFHPACATVQMTWSPNAELDERRHFRAIREAANSACAEVGLGTVGTGRAVRPRREPQPWALTVNPQTFSTIPAGEPVPEDFWAP
jgi:hypothetical protein